MNVEKITIKGAREHNLKDINLNLPRNKLIVMTGISGSGKSSLAFDTLYAEGQRRYVESLSSYARQFLGQMEKPDVDLIEGLSPSISIDQKSRSANPRSTVGTVTEIYDYLRVLYARAGIPHCPECGRTISRQTPQQIADRIMELPDGSRIMILAPLVRGRKGEHRGVLEALRQKGYVRVIVDGEIRDLEDDITLDKKLRHDIEAVVDRLIIRDKAASRLAESVETALDLGDGLLTVKTKGDKIVPFSRELACVYCGISYDELSPRMFSFNSPYGACEECSGLGYHLEIDPELAVPDLKRSLSEGAIAPWEKSGSEYLIGVLRALSKEYGIDLQRPFKDLPEKHRRIVLYGTGEKEIDIQYYDSVGRLKSYYTRYEGVIPNLERRYKETESDYTRGKIGMFMSIRPCPACGGARLKPEALAVTVGGFSIAELCDVTVVRTMDHLRKLRLDRRSKIIAERLLKEIKLRLQFMVDVGLDYLTLSRYANTLAGGEAQRIRLATQIGSGLVGVIYILDEPSVGLHHRDNDRLISTLKRLRDLGNTVIVVEHDESTIRAADFIVDIGPGAGIHGGEIIATGSVDDIVADPRSITGMYLSGKRSIPLPDGRRDGNGRVLTVHGASEHNLKSIDVEFPLGRFICVTGVSGSGKSTLVDEVLYRALRRKISSSRMPPGRHEGLSGIENIDKVVNIDQAPIGRTPRSNPVTYTKTFDYIRALFAKIPLSQMRGYKLGRFSFNVSGGRCEACRGEGMVKIEMHFLPDVYVTCDVCKGSRFNRESLEVRYKGKNISDVLNMTVEEALELFENVPPIKRHLAVLNEVGLGYITLGQSATTLSGGEAQRIKLARELTKRATGKTLYILDEPTTGLHFDDIMKLINVLNKLVEGGNAVIVIEHNLDVIKVADYIIDLGPEGGDEGGQVVATGTPEEIAKAKGSYTGRYLKEVLKDGRAKRK